MSENSAKIMLVDDDQGFLTLLSMRLSAEGYTVETASSGRECLAKITQFLPDLMISDLRMDMMDGMELYGKVQKLMPYLPVIMITAHGSIPEAVAATQQGVYSFVPKPIDRQHLFELIRQALVQKGGISQQLAEQGSLGLYSRNQKMLELIEQLRMVAPSEASVLITGESGVGKELFAQALHAQSSRASGPFIAINCAAIPADLLESELFGHVRGAFTGANKDHPGLIQSAKGGSLFLDEIGDMPLSLQVKLLRVIEEKKVRPVGSTQSVATDVRLISATHRDLPSLIAEKVFREDLFYRLNVISMHLPPLRERREDIPVLAEAFLQDLASKQKPSVRGFAAGALELLTAFDWPGNIRQLYNAVEKMLILAPGAIISAAHVRWCLGEHEAELLSLAEAKNNFERDYLIETLKKTHGNVSKAARAAKRNRTDFYKLMARHNLQASMFKGPQARAESSGV